MFTTKEEALAAMQEILSALEMMLEYADEEELEFCAGDPESLHNTLFESVLQLKKSNNSYLDIEMRNHVSLTVIQARQALKEVEFYF